jgi:hypothetical protein
MEIKFKQLPISVKMSRLSAVIVVSTMLAISSLFLNIGVAEADSPPTAVLTANPSTINEGETSTLDASGSSDPDIGDSLTYDYRILDNGPGTITQTGDSNPIATYEAPSDVSSDQTVTIRVVVTSGSSDTSVFFDTATVEILVTDNPPPPPLTEQFPDQGSCINEANSNPDAGFTKDDCKAAFKDKVKTP